MPSNSYTHATWLKERSHVSAILLTRLKDKGFSSIGRGVLTSALWQTDVYDSGSDADWPIGSFPPAGINRSFISRSGSTWSSAPVPSSAAKQSFVRHFRTDLHSWADT